MAKQKVLITGTGGFIFSNFVRKFIYEDKPYEFISIDKITKSSILNNIYPNKNHEFYIGDITDEHFINVIFEYKRPDIIVHGAAETFVDDALKEPNKFIQANVLGTQVLLNASVKWGIKRFIYASTDEVYGQLEKETDPLWTETSKLNPRNPYSASKAAGELLVQAMGSSFGLNYSITRSCNNYGPRQTSEKFIPKVIKCIFENKKIPVYGQGLQMRDWLHVFDSSAAIMKVMEDGKDREVYNISANQEFSNIEVVHEICNVMGKGHDLIEFVKDRPGHDFRYGIDSSKIRDLGWKPNFKFKSGLAQAVEWYSNNQWFLK
jgi:dTDP-glucose 4,6-dehydratase